MVHQPRRRGPSESASAGMDFRAYRCGKCDRPWLKVALQGGPAPTSCPFCGSTIVKRVQ